ncbi:MAG: C40 family peptidase [Lachnospiraceae bacterium]|nr:C40 family peptidase [Lachnospiraceae bacterium]
MKKRAVCFLTAFLVGLMPALQVYGTTISDAKQQKKETEEKLSNVQNDIDELEEGIEETEAEIEEIDGQLVVMLMTVDILKSDIADKEVAIAQAEEEYEAALAKEEAQREAMKLRIKFMYEKGDPTYAQLFLQSQSMADLLNKVDYTEKLYDYDRKLLLEYQYTKQEVFEAKTTLEEEKAEIEEVEADLEEQSAELQQLLDEKRKTAEDFDAQLNAAKGKAKEYQNQIKAQAAQIKQLEAEEAARKKAEAEAKKRAEEEALKKKLEEERKQKEAQKEESTQETGENQGEEIPVENETQEQPEEQPEEQKEEKSEESGSGGSGGSGGGSGKGQEIANYACQFVGNPYVAGGTSLTEGCDCSGFTGAVYAHFGISLPRSSYAQSTAGQEVSVSDMQPGDILYYGGHVGIYIGNGTIVHASTAATGIKYSSAYYRTIIAVRRFV